MPGTPWGLSIGTGFVYDYEEETHSPQLDIIVYNESRRAALYRKGDFIVVERGEVVNVAEVKKTLTLTDLRAVIKKTINCRFGTPGYVSPSQEMVTIFAYACKSRSQRIADCIAAEVHDFINHFRYQTRGGMEVAFGTRHIALPTIYFFDRDEHISTNVRVDSSGICKVVVDVLHSAHRGTDGLNEFLKAMLGKEHGFRADLFSVSLFQTEYSVDVPAPLILVEKLTMPELASRFPSDLTALTRLEVKGQQPLFALVPACFSWNSVKTLEDFIGHSKIEWE